MITNLQVIRALAALAIVFYHTDFRLFSDVHTDFTAVRIFFVLSGFIMSYSTRKDSRNFLVKRVVRIVPLYWISTTLILIWGNLGFTNPYRVLPLFLNWLIKSPFQILVWIQQNHGLDNQTTLLALVKSFFFIPYINSGGNIKPLLGIGWTLNLEIFFYLIFALSLKISKKYAPILAIIFIGTIELMTKSLECDLTLCLFYYSQNIVWLFVIGIICFYIWDAVTEKTTKKFKGLLLWSAIFLAITFFVLNLTPIAEFSVFVQTIFYYIGGYILPALVILCTVLLQKAGWQCTWAPILLLGDASYALYLTHTLFIETFANIGQHFPLFDPKTSPISVLLILGMTSLFAIVVYKKVELPLLKYLRIKFVT